MKAFLLVITLLIPIRAAAQDVRLPLERIAREVEGTWETGERFRAELFYQRPESTEEPVFSKWPTPFMTGRVALRIYAINEDGAERLITENMHIERYSDSGNFFVTPLLAIDENGSLILITRSNNSPEKELTIIKHDGEIIISEYYYGRPERNLSVLQNQNVSSENARMCAVDLLSGRRIINGSGDMIELLGVIRVEDWTVFTAEEFHLCPFV